MAEAKNATVNSKQVEYLKQHRIHDVVEKAIAELITTKPNEPVDYLISWLQHFKNAELFRQKMLKDKLSDAFINTFLQNYKALTEGSTGLIGEDTIEPVADLQKLSSLTEKENPDLLKATVVLKLNGGLGTGMGLEKAKSLLKVRGEDNFLDLTVKQIQHLRQQYSVPLKFMLMNSFSTSEDTKQALAKYEGFWEEDTELFQNKAPKVDVATLAPAEHPANAELEWNPPGHGDLYAALYGSGKLDKLLKDGYKYMFVSNSDNLGATLDLKLLSHFARSGAPMCMEVCERTESDRKGGHLAKDAKTKQLILREAAQCADEDAEKFQDITRHKFFNTNNLWLNLEKLKKEMDAKNGVLSLPLIRNKKTVDPRDGKSKAVFQLETAMGAAIASLPRSEAIVVPRARFAPVKTCNDLLLVRSDVYVVTEDSRLVLAEERKNKEPFIDLDGKYYKMVDQLEEAIPEGVPSLIKLERLKVTGPVKFEAGAVLEGEVEIINKDEERKTAGSVSGTTLTL